MKNLISILAFLFFTNIILGQSVQNLGKYKAPKSLDNIQVTPLETDEETSSFIIFVSGSVPLHRHDLHTEQVYVLEGKGTMILGEETIKVKKGDYIYIPKGVPHSVKVTSKKPMKVLSIQSPRFEGKDRIFIDK